MKVRVTTFHEGQGDEPVHDFVYETKSKRESSEAMNTVFRFAARGFRVVLEQQK